MPLDHPIILVDQDGPLANWESEFLNRWRLAHPRLPFVELCDREHFNVADDLAERVPPEQREDIRAKVAAIYCSSGFIRGLPLVDGAKDALSEMLADGYRVEICTSPLRRYENCVLEKYLWVEKHLGPDFTDRIVMCRRKSLVRGNFLIDDRPDAAERDGVAPLWKHIVFNAPYNRDVAKLRLNQWSDWRKLVLT